MQGGHLEDGLLGVLCFKDEVGLASLAVFDRFLPAVAGPGVLEVVDRVGHEGDEADALAEELVVED